MILITSAAYLVSEFQHEFGALPPAFLPVGNKRLFERQIEAIREIYPNEEIMLSIPEDFNLPLKDQKILEKLAVKVVKLENGLSLAVSLIRFLEVSKAQGVVRILHGDTLIDFKELIGNHQDLIGLADTSDDYDWEVVNVASEGELVWCGYFSFSDSQLLIQALLETKNFVKAVKLYANQTPLNKCKVNSWLDFGHINTYYKSRALLTTERSFNQLKISEGIVRKTSVQANKINAEANWFKSIPAKLKIYTPQLIDSGSPQDPYYELEYLCMSPLNELYVHSRKPTFFWSKAFRLLKDWFSKCSEEKVLDGVNSSEVKTNAESLIMEKSRKRLQQFSEEANFDINSKIYYQKREFSSLKYILEECISKSLALPTFVGVTHGDLCFSNILYDSRGDRLKLIDPRGLDFQGKESIYGDIKYDLAKLTHSVVGMYDFIISGAYELNSEEYKNGISYNLIFENEELREVQEAFLDHTFLTGMKTREILPLTILLFLSMLPLHSDHPDRQEAFIANALRLYQNFKDET